MTEEKDSPGKYKFDPEFVETINAWIREGTNGKTIDQTELDKRMGEEALNRKPITHMWTVIDQDDTLLTELGGDLPSIQVYSKLNDVIGKMLNRRYTRSKHYRPTDKKHSFKTHPYHDYSLLTIVDDLDIEEAVQLADNTRKDLNLGISLSINQKLRNPLTVSCLLWVPTAEQMRSMGFNPQSPRLREAEQIRYKVFQKLQLVHDGMLYAKREQEGNPYTALGKVIWIDPQQPHIIRAK
ncbi:MAG: hypothetical protein Q7K55_02080 [Candidatus Levybacteria bacterium]|nr:hypothetical protein [Candidatus Levybacteria bacterium]